MLWVERREAKRGKSFKTNIELLNAAELLLALFWIDVYCRSYAPMMYNDKTNQTDAEGRRMMYEPHVATRYGTVTCPR